MKIQTAVKGLFSDAETSVASKIEVISFLRRYSSAVRPCTHYSCRGKSTEAIVKLLEAMGMKPKKDFEVAASALDPEFNQIRWAKDARAVSKMTMQLSTVPLLGDARVFDKLYARVVNRKPVDDLLAQFTDDTEDNSGDGSGSKYVNDANGRHFSLALLRRTEEIARAVIALHRSYVAAGGAESDMAASLPPNFDLAINAAAEYLDKYFKADGSMTSDASPYMLPLSILELYCRVVKADSWCDDKGFAAGDPDKKPPLLFKVSPAAIDLVRLMRKGDNLVWLMCLNAPLEYLWEFGTDTGGDDNPLHGYFFRDAKSVLNASLDDKVGVFVGGNAEMIHEEGADNNVTVAACVQNHDVFWTYVLELYSRAYSCNAGMSCQSRVGVPIIPSIWGPNLPSCAPSVSAHARKWRKMHESAFDVHGFPLLAEYAVMLSDKHIDMSFIHPGGFMRSNEHVKLVKTTGESAIPDFGNLYLRKEELAWEWFAMTHLDHTAGKLGRDKIQYTTTSRPAKEGSLVENLARFKAMMASADEANMANMSNCTSVGSPFLAACDGYGRPSYTPLSAMFDGVCAVLRKTWKSAPGRAAHPLPVVKKKTGTPRNQDVLVTNVYSGISTNQSPALGSDDDTGAVFPTVEQSTDGKFSAGVKAALHCSNECCEAVTRFLDRMNAGSMEQVHMAKRTAGTRRVGVMVFETNINAEEFLATADERKLSIALGTVFLQTILLNNATPACSLDDDALNDTNDVTYGRYSDTVYRLVHDYVHVLFEKSEWPTIPSGVYDPQGDWFSRSMNVATLKDADGRMVIVFHVKGDLLTFARLMYRYGCGFPIDTAYVKEMLYSSGDGSTVEVKDGEWGSVKLADKIIGNYIGRSCSDTDGNAPLTTASNGDCGPLFRAPMSYVPEGRAPNREWYIAGTRSTIGVNSVIHYGDDGSDCDPDCDTAF